MSTTEHPVLKAMVVGCGGMGRNQARILHRMPEFELVAVCDLLEENARRAAEGTDATVYTDFAEALEAEQPRVVAVPSNNATHAPLTIQAAACPAVQAIYTEKPMALSMGEARAMVQACEDAGVKLVINHQRRIQPDMVKARQLIEAGAIGPVRRVRVQNAGDILSDGTHAVDSALHLLGDPEVEWVFGALHREINQEMIDRAEAQQAAGKQSRPGYRYGHPVENGGMALAQVAGDAGPRIELFCGDMREQFRIYQDYEVFGDKGRIWRTGDKHEPNLFIQDAEGGTWGIGLDEWTLKPVEGEGSGGWRPVPVQDRKAVHGIERGLRHLALWIHEGRPHEMCAANALRGFEIIMAVYESARLGKKVELPLQQDEFPLQLMVDALEHG